MAAEAPAPEAPSAPPLPASASAMAAEPARDRVARDLGAETAELYAEGVRLTKAGSVEAAGERGAAAEAQLQQATEVLAKALAAIGEEKATTAGFAEMLLAYGQVLLVFVRRERESKGVFGEGTVEQGVVGGAVGLSKQKQVLLEMGAGVDGDEEVVRDVEKKQSEDGRADSDDDDDEVPVPDPGASAKPGASEGAKDTNGNEESGGNKEVGKPEKSVAIDSNKETANAEEPFDDGSEQDLDELMWEQLEVSRAIFEKLGPLYSSRLSAVHHVLGDYLADSDAHERAAVEYEKAASASVEATGVASRRVAELHHARHLSLRHAAPHKAVSAMQDAIDAFEAFVAGGTGDAEDVETIRMLKEDLAAYEEALAAALEQKRGTDAKTVIGFAKSDPPPPSSAGEKAAEEVRKAFDGQPAASKEANGQGDGEVHPVFEDPVAVVVKPKRRGKPIPVVPSEAEMESGALGGNDLATVPVSTEDVVEPASKKARLE